jgi:hypothetical protein
MKKWIPVILGVAIVILIGYTIWEANRPVYFGPNMHVIDEPKIDTNAWQPYKNISPDDTGHVYRVLWSQKYGMVQAAYCVVVFRNDKEKQYKLVAPWLDGLEIERANMDDIKFDKISKDSVPKEVFQKK